MQILWGFAVMAILLEPLNVRSAETGPDLSKLPADATVTIKGGLVSAGIGYEWGRGTMTYQGKEYPFCIRGLAVGEVGAAGIDTQGVVFHMGSPGDFPGKYSAVSLGAAVIKGESSALLKNRRGVTLQLDSRVTGLRFNIAASGVKIALAGTRGCAADAQKR